MKWWVARDGRRVEVALAGDGQRFHVRVDGRPHEVALVPVGPHLAALLQEDGRSFAVAHQRQGPGRWRIFLGEREFIIALRDPLAGHAAARREQGGGPQEIRAPIPGKVVRVQVECGQEVAAGQTLLVLEAMKMENPIVAEGPGRVEEMLVRPGHTVEGGQLLVVLR